MKPKFYACLLLGLLVISPAPIHAAASLTKLKTRNVILITLDGLRWQELFTGAEAQLMTREIGGVAKTNELRQKYWRETPEARREALLPFFWSVVAKQGQVFGNPHHGSVVKVSNGFNFSYPGYNEILTGSADPRIDSNDKRPNPNVSVLEWLNQKPAWRGKIAAFASWEVMPYILNRDRSGLHVRAGWEPMAVGKLNPRRELLNQLIADTTPAWDEVIYDSFTFHGAMDYFREHKPKVLYVAFGETDDWAHDGRYDQALHAAHSIDQYLKRLWDAVQSLPGYRGQTTFLITVDHGRGSGTKEWKDHGRSTAGSEYIWLAAIGPDTPALGERANTPLITQSQIAATVAAFLDEDYCAAFPKAGKPVNAVLGR